MSTQFDVIVIGSGPAGVSAALPLLKAGLEVLMVDGGSTKKIAPPSTPYLTARSEDENQWKWMVGEDFYALQRVDAVSPKLRTPTLDYVFDNFAATNHIRAENFVAIGSLSAGGLSNAWGCGVARLSANELKEFPFQSSDMAHSYETVAKRMGISGAETDDLSDYFGLDKWSSPGLPMDALHNRLSKQYSFSKAKLLSNGFRLGRSRVAVLSRDNGSRSACDLSGTCLWGCHRKALYSAADELTTLMQYKNLTYQSGFIVERVASHGDYASIQGQAGTNRATVTARRVLLAAGTLASTRLALAALDFKTSVHLLSTPTAAFLIWLPKMFGAPRSNGFGLGQLSFTMDLLDGITGFGSTFSTGGLPVAEFVRHLPLRKRYGIDLLRQLLSSCLVGNIFLPGHLSASTASLDIQGDLIVRGGYNAQVPNLMENAARRLRASFWKLGAWLLPMSFTVGMPGGDIHYSGTLPMRHSPKVGETNAEGELEGLRRIHAVDGACLPTLTEKSHTLTIMANADRIAHTLVARLKGELNSRQT